jgi:hypothetical protein
MPTKKNRSHAKLVIICLIAVVAIILVGSWLYSVRKTSNNVSKPTVTGTPSKPTPHTTAPSTNNGTTNSGGVTDTNGQTTGSIPPSSEWTTSSNGDITLQQPTQNQNLSSGDAISGLANVSQVSFILKDSTVGVIAQGTLNVVNGKFAGNLTFTSHSNSGTLELYYANPADGAEEDIINVNVDFNG